LAVATFGTLTESKDNAILVTTWFSGTHQIWRDVYIGPGHALDPEHNFIVVVDQIGSGLSTSPHNATGANAEIARSRFPHVRIGEDMVFPVRDCRPEQELITGSELRVVNDVLGHLGLFGSAPTTCRRSTGIWASCSAPRSEPASSATAWRIVHPGAGPVVALTMSSAATTWSRGLLGSSSSRAMARWTASPVSWRGFCATVVRLT